jgi:Nif-specific regulatory protein
MKLLTNLHTSCFLSGDKPLTLLNTSHMVHLSLVHGNSEESAYAYMLYASMHVVPERQDYKSGYEFGQLALRVNERFYDPAIRAKALMNFAWSVNIWRMPMASSIPIGREAFRLGTETGMFVETAYALFNDCWFALLSDSDLDACRRTCKANVDYTKRIKMFHFAGGAPQVILQWGLALQGLTEHPLSFTDGSFDEEAFRRNYMGQPLFEMFYFDAKLAVLYTFEEYHAACEIAEQAERVIKDFSGTIWDEIRVYYHALTLAALHATATPAERSEIEKNLDAWNARLKKWAENSPYNFRAQHLIVSAEIARLRAQALEAMSLYEAAIAASAEQECPRERALANELCAKFWLNHAQKKVAAVFMQEARSAYAQWGGLAKVKDLEQRYPHLLSPTRTESGTPVADGQASHLTIGRRLEFLDLQTVIKAAQVISGEMTLSRLLEKMMRIVMENAGAQKGILALEKEGELFIEAEGIFGKKANGPATLRGQNGEDEVIALHSIPLEPSGKLALAVVNFVRRTGESLVVPNAVSDSRFAHDTYIVQNQPQSIFCLPILHQSKFIGMLYLENNLTTDAFTPDRIEVMQMLAAQSAIALENARLYEETKQEVAERKHAEEALRAALFEVEQLKNRLQAENVYLQEEIRTQQNYEEIVGASPAIRIVFRNIEKVAPTDSTVLLIGATGTGKELVARAIHSSSHRNANALITVNCGALPSGLIESELFGHEKGAFTGATARKKGRFELADGGTIFLDEIGELPLETQAKLLRVLQEQEFERVGATQTIKVNVRVIAATNRDLEEAVRLGAFRTDLFYRLNIFPIHLPALRERSEDIPTLTNHFVSKFSRRLGKKIDRVSAEALERLTHYVWPGNVRELANVLERAVILCDGGVLQIDHLAISSQVPKPEMEVATLQEAERAHILKALQETKWVVGGPNGAAKRLGLNRTTLLARMKKLGIEKE